MTTTNEILTHLTDDDLDELRARTDDRDGEMLGVIDRARKGDAEARSECAAAIFAAREDAEL